MRFLRETNWRRSRSRVNSDLGPVPPGCYPQHPRQQIRKTTVLPYNNGKDERRQQSPKCKAATPSTAEEAHEGEFVRSVWAVVCHFLLISYPSPVLGSLAQDDPESQPFDRRALLEGSKPLRKAHISSTGISEKVQRVTIHAA